MTEPTHPAGTDPSVVGTDEAITPQSQLLWFRLGALALAAAARESGQSASITLKIVEGGDLRVDFGFPEGTPNPEQLYQRMLHHFRQYGDLFEAQHRIQALGEHGVSESQMAQEHARWRGRLPLAPVAS